LVSVTGSVSYLNYKCVLFLAFVAPSVDTTDRYGPVITAGGVGGVSGDFSETDFIP